VWREHEPKREREEAEQAFRLVCGREEAGYLGHQAENGEREMFSFFFSISFVLKPFSHSNLDHFWDFTKPLNTKRQCTSMDA
jgi:hypothetical protein